MPPVLLFHCSDVHVTGDYFGWHTPRLGWRRVLALAELTVGGRSRAYARAAVALARIAERAALEADHLVVSGDLTAYALEEEFVSARAALAALGGDPRRVSVVPGNHDVFTPEAAQARLFERHFGDLLASDFPEHRREGAWPYVRVLGDGGAAVVGLNSARVPPVPGLAYGWVGAQQLDGLRAVVAEPRLARAALVVVVHHAPLRESGVPDSPGHGLRDGEALLAALPGPRFAVLHGHIHRRYTHAASATRPFVFGAGSSTEAGREGFWALRLEGGRVAGARPVPLDAPPGAAAPA